MALRSSTLLLRTTGVLAATLLSFALASVGVVPAAAAEGDGVIEGTVTGAGAGPLDGIEVIAVGENGYEDSSVVTDAAGSYRLDLASATYRLVFSPAQESTWAPEMWRDAPTAADAAEVVVSAGSSATADAELAVGGSVSGRATCGGASLGEADVSVSSITNSWLGRSATTKSDGSYLVTGIASGEHDMSITGYGDCRRAGPIPVSVGSGEERSGVDVDLELGGSIAGTIFGANGSTQGQVIAHSIGADGLAGAVVGSWPASSGEGYVVHALPEGDYLVEYDALTGSQDQWHPAAPTSAGAVPVHVDPGVSTTAIDFAPIGGATITGTVGGYFAEHPSFFRVTASLIGAPEGEQVQVGEVADDGTYSIPFLPEGEYLVSVPSMRDDDWTALTDPQWFRDADGAEDAESVPANGTATTAGVDFVLRATGSLEPTASIEGTVSLPWRGVLTSREYSVTAWRQDPATLRWSYAGSDYGASDEPYRIDGLEPGRYAVRAQQSIDGPAATPSYRPEFPGGVAVRENSALVDLAADGTAASVDIELGPWRFTSERVAGVDRYETAARLSREFVPAGVPVVYIASGANWPDALSAGPAAAHLGGTLLTTDPSSLPSSTRAEIERLSPDRIVIAGSALSVSDTVLRQLRDLVPDVRRIGGVDRYETSRLLVADAYDRAPEYTYLATGANFPDALAVAGAAGANSPVVLVDGARPVADEATKTLLRSLQVRSAQAVGGEPSIPRSLMKDLVTSGAIERDYRIFGSDRYGTAAALADWTPRDDGRAFVASGEGFADALGVAAVAARSGTPVILSEQSCLRTEAADSLGRNLRPVLTLLGQEGRVSENVVRARC
ncbi:cell wall-binding repeat-containing protein [Rathayibacter festucae]|uniref:cell wall-binding repeat-containing protein n=1 Tax=Rathayibacter festucae TaxID=110937 RepID=UPI002A6AC6F6|nr:cell wall-binding repeat-containing protein [Rathayibacter festucae]MDY0913692.1 cell wall-binding repeat-containing protein [Rathayibacter festucae]